MPPSLRSVGDHRAAVLAAVTRLPPEHVELDQALGRTLARDVRSGITLPPFANSAMDGFAVRQADVAAAPVTLPVAADVPAGAPMPRPLRPGTAARVMTGAPLPDGCDAVVPVEWTDVPAGPTGPRREVTINQSPQPGAYIRASGEDVVPGVVLVGAGTVLSARHLGLLAATGHGRVPVSAQPRVAVVATGAELLAPESTLTPGRIYDSNSYCLAAAVHQVGGVATRVVVTDDTAAAVASALDSVAAENHLVITTGGVSAGAYDVVKSYLAAAGGVEFVKVGMRPGMPQGVGRLRTGNGEVALVALPGNPVSAWVSFEVFCRPALCAMQGRAALDRPTVTARASRDWSSPPHKVEFARVRLTADAGGWLAEPVGAQGSHLVADLAHADALAVVRAEVTSVTMGMTLTCIPLPEDG